MSLKFKRHYKLLVLLALFTVVLALGLGDQRIVAYTVQNGGQAVGQSTGYSRNVALLDDTLASNNQIPVSGTGYR